MDKDKLKTASYSGTRHHDDFLDAITYCYNDVVTTIGYCVSLNPLFLEIKNVIFNEPATIVLWTDGTKTVVKCSEDDTYDPEKGLAMAISKKILGNRFKSTFKKYIPEQQENEYMCLDTFIEHIRKWNQYVTDRTENNTKKD